MACPAFRAPGASWAGRVRSFGTTAQLVLQGQRRADKGAAGTEQRLGLRVADASCEPWGYASDASTCSYPSESDDEDGVAEDWKRSKQRTSHSLNSTSKYCARLLSGELVAELPGKTKVFVARLEIARALRVGAPQVHLLSGFSSLDDNAILSDALADSVDKSMSVVVVKDLRRPQKILKAQALIALGQFSIARELLEGIGEAPEARSLLETAISSELTRPSRRIEIQQQLDLL
mmetsp:Transcript_58610/g.152589  ORF Transcript_58610/g.152589 Transcript_58610/m.152589 type:complete len:234 (-) Transcript_58610:254-955(-)